MESGKPIIPFAKEQPKTTAQKIQQLKGIKKVATKQASSPTPRAALKETPKKILPPKPVEEKYDEGVIYDEVNGKDDLDIGPLEIEEPTERKTEDVLFSLSKLFKKEGIKHYPCSFVDETMQVYPKSTNLRCMSCRDKIETIPVLVPIRYDEKKPKPWLLDCTIYCSINCATDAIMKSGRSTMYQKFGLLFRFLREFADVPPDAISYVSIGYVEGFCRDPKMSMEEYKRSSGYIYSLEKEPPCTFVPRWIEEVDLKKREETQKKDFERLLSVKPTKEQQDNFRNAQIKVMQEQKLQGRSIENTPIGKKMGIKQM